jgi:hypothetical protein
VTLLYRKKRHKKKKMKKLCRLTDIPQNKPVPSQIIKIYDRHSVSVSSRSVEIAFRTDDARTVDQVFLQSDDWGEAKSGHNLHVKDLFDDPIKLDVPDQRSAADVDNTNPALLLSALLGDGYAAEYGGLRILE